MWASNREEPGGVMIAGKGGHGFGMVNGQGMAPLGQK